MTTLQLLHATDLESGFEQITTAANMKILADYYSNNDTLFISSGDNFIPGPYFNAAGDYSMRAVYNKAFNDFYNLDGDNVYEDLRNEVGFADIAIMNLLEIDASVIGNHEFDAGASVFGDMITHYPRGAGLENDRWIGAQFPYLSSNLDFSKSGLGDFYTDEILSGADFEITPEEAAAVTAKYQDESGQKKLAPAVKLTTDGGETYGVIGVTTPYLASISSPGLVEVVNADGTRNDTIYNSDTRDAEMTELAKLVQVQVDRLEASGVNKIILTSHLQDFAYEKLLATKLDGVDIIIAGGSDTILANDADDLRAGDVASDTYPVTNITDLSGNSTYLVSTDGQFNYLGRLNATFDDDGHVVSVDTQNSGPISTETENVAAITGLKLGSDGNIDLSDDGLNAGSSLIEKASIIDDVVSGLEAVAASKDSNVVGLTDVYLEGRRSKVRTEETNLGDLSADSLLHATRQFDTVFAFKNGGGIRSEIGDSSTDENNITTFTAPLANEQTGREEGEVSQLAIETSLKFNNGVTLLELSGSDLKEILEHGVKGFLNADSQPGQFPQVGGLYFSVDMDQQAGDRITEIALVDQDGFVTQHIYNNGSFVGDAATQEFRGASLNFLVENDGDGYPFSTLAQNVEVIDGFGEQEAFAMLMSDQYLVEAYDTAETSKTYDTRIQFMDSEIFGEGREALVSLIPEASRSVAPKVASSTKLGSVADEGGAEIVSVDGAIAAVTNGIDNRVEILDMEDPEHPVHLGALDVSEMASDDITLVGGITSFDLGEGITSVAIKGETVVASYKNGDVSLGGYVVTYKVPGGDLASATAMVSQVGVQPDCVILNADGTLAFTADEGEITIVNGEYVDPQGSISIIDTATGAVTKIGFDHLDAATLKAAGVRISDASSSAAADIEPEYVALSDDETLLFVTLQENNAVAKIDISGIVAGQTVNAADIMEILPLGYKDHNLAGNELDASDRDGEINITNHNLWGMYMPDTIKSYEVNGTNYFVIANEGDGRGDVDDMGEKGKFGDEARVKDLGDPGLPSLDADAGYTPEELANDQLGRLKISVLDGDTDGDGDIDQLVTFGARSFSIFDANGQLVFDSGSDFEAITASLSPLSFNDDNGENGENRSDAKGPEPEALEIVRAGDSVYAIIGMERVNYVMVYDITDPSHATFINAVDIRAFGDIAPEGMDVGVNENGDLMLYIASEVSSTVTAHYLTGNIEDDHGDSVIEGTDGADSIIQGAGSDVIVGNGGTDFYATSGHTSVISILDDADVALLERFHGDIFEDGASVARVETFTQFAVSESVDYVQVERLEHAGKILSFDDVELTPTLTDHGGDNHVRLGVGHYAVNMGDGHDEVAISHGNAVRLGDGDDTLFVSHGHDMVAELGDGHDMVVITNDAAIDLSIVDFAEGDQIDMSAIGVTAMSDMQMDLDNDGNILIQHGEVDITLVTGTANLTMGDIDASDFVFAAEII